VPSALIRAPALEAPLSARYPWLSPFSGHRPLEPGNRALTTQTPERIGESMSGRKAVMSIPAPSALKVGLSIIERLRESRTGRCGNEGQTGSEMRELRRRLKRRFRNRQRLSLYCRRLGLLPGLAAYFRLVFYNTRPVPVRLPGSGTTVLIRPDTTDPFIFEEVFLLDEYSFDTPAEPRLILDIGANVGYASVYFAEKYPSARIIAVEPETSNIRQLKANTAGHPNVRVVEAGIWNRNACLTLVDPGARSSDFQLRECRPGEQGTEAVTVEHLMELAGSDHADIVKIDIEGGEKELFSENVDWLGKVDTLVIELHDRFKPGCKDTFLEATARFGFSGREIGLNYIARRSAAPADGTGG
jgi:FkbM family methyltransferase